MIFLDGRLNLLIVSGGFCCQSVELLLQGAAALVVELQGGFFLLYGLGLRFDFLLFCFDCAVCFEQAIHKQAAGEKEGEAQ